MDKQVEILNQFMTTNQSERQSTLRINHDRYIELQFAEVSRQAVDDLMAHLLDTMAENTTQQTLRIFVNNGQLQQAQSIAYLLGQLRQHQRHFVVPYTIRVAANFNMILIASLIEIFIRSVPNSTIQFKGFQINDADAAVAWLIDG